ncbi:MAG TPA: type IV secretion system DNA-binding domain-containing protein [Allosphingosinicella sp.]|nr:type IV secretion system DNA-binding domain-containing protein [Allosphingosinicella sp.]
MDQHGPSTYTPFLRRFGSERARELKEVRALYDRLVAYQRHLPETKQSIAARVVDLYDYRPLAVREVLDQALWELLEEERQIWELPDPDFGRMNLREFVEYRNLLTAKSHFFANQEEMLELLEDGLVRVLCGPMSELPETEDPSPFTIPLANALPDTGLVVEKIFGTLADYFDRGLFKGVTRTIYENGCQLSGRDPNDPNSRKPLIPASESKLKGSDVVRAYLRSTPFERIFAAPIPLKLTHEERYNHWHVLGGSGHGKSLLIEQLINFDVSHDDHPSIVLIDPHSDLVRKLMRSPLGAYDKVILFDPRDTAFPIALNPLAVNRERLGKYDEGTREQVTAGVIQTFGYLWNGLTNLTLTGKQDVFFRYVTRLLLTLPEVRGENATILDMLRLMTDAKAYEDVIEALPPIPKDFFRTDFSQKTFDGTKEQVRYRIQAIIENPTMARLFTAAETKVDFFTELNAGSIILVDTAKDFLKEGSAIFGKLMISLILQAVLERAAIPERQRKPTFLMVDEAGSFFSQNIDDLLTEARKYKCGLLLAHQYLDQASGSLRASLAANTGIKFAGGLSAADASVMAREMRTDADFILSQPKRHFAGFIRGTTPQAVSIPIELPQEQDRLSDDAFHLVMERNRARVSLGTDVPAAERTDEDSGRVSHRCPGTRQNIFDKHSSDDPDEEVSREW